MPRRREHPAIDGESPASRRRRLHGLRRNQQIVRRNLVSSQVSTPDDSPATRRLRTRRHENRRSRGLPSETPPTPVIVDTDLPIRAGTVRTTPGAAAVRTNHGPTCEPNLSVLPIVRRRVVTACPTGVNPPALRTLRKNSMVTENVPRIRSLNGCLRRIGSGRTIEYVGMSEHPDGDA